MDLSRGICILCTNNTKIIVPPQAEDKTSLIKDILADQIDHVKFDEVNSSLKVCPICLCDLITVADLKQNMKEEISEHRDSCILCYTEKDLVYIAEWANFDKMLENVTTEKRHFKCFTCLACIKCLDLLEKIKTNLFKKYPNLELSEFSKDKKKYGAEKLRKASPNKRETSKRAEKRHSPIIISDEETDWSPQRTYKNVNNLRAALKHLKPLKNTQFKIGDFKKDKKLLKQIAFVNLSVTNLLTKNYKKLDVKPKKSAGSKRSVGLNDSDSSRDSPSPKQSFFKIKLKINPNKIKPQKVTSGKVTKPKAHKNRLTLANKKELIVKILKMNLDDLREEYEESMDIRTPTKASRKMMPEDSTSSGKKRKSVTFADVLDTEIPEGTSRKNPDVAPLKSLLKKSVSPTTDLLNNGNGTSDESDNETNKIKRKSELNVDSDEDLGTAKGYVEEILKNNDNIFDSLKTATNTEEESKKTDKNGSSSGIDSNSSDSEDSEAHKLSGKSKKKPLRAEKSKRKKSIESDTDDSENNSGSEAKTSKGNGKKENGSKGKTNKRRKGSTSDDSDDSEKHKSEDKEIKSNRKKDDEDIITKDVEVENNLDKSAHNHKNSLNSNSDSEQEENAEKENGKDTDPVENGDKENETSSKTDGSNVEFLDISSTETDKCSQETKELNKDPLSAGESKKDQMVTLEEFKNIRSDQNEGIESKVDENNGKGTPNEDSDKDSLEMTNENKPNDESVNENNQANDKHSSDIESDLENSIKSNNSYDSSNSKRKSRKRRKSIVDGQEDETLTKSNVDEDIEEPETKREKVSGIDDRNNSENIDERATDSEDKSLGVTKERKTFGTVDDKIDELISKYTNPGGSNLNNDVSDSQHAGVSDQNRGSGSEISTEESEEAVNKGNDDKEINLEGSTEDADEKGTSLVEKDSEGDDTINSDVTEKNDGTLNELDLDNIIDNVVDSC